MASAPAYPSAVVDLADSWHRLLTAQRALSDASLAARDATRIARLRHEVSEAFDVAIELTPEFVRLRITPHIGAPNRLHIWATPDLLVVRTQVEIETEHLVRLPASVEPDGADVEVHDTELIVTLPRRVDGPIVVWPES